MVKRKWPDISKEDIQEAFKELDTQADVARFFEVPDWKIAELRKKYGIYEAVRANTDKGGRGARKKIDKDELISLRQKGLSYKQIAKYFGVHYSTILSRRKEFGIEVDPKNLTVAGERDSEDSVEEVESEPEVEEPEVDWDAIEAERRKLFMKVEGLSDNKIDRVRNCGDEVYIIFNEGYAMKMSFNGEAVSDKVKLEFLTPTQVETEEAAIEKLEQARRLEEQMIRLRSEANNIRGIDNATVNRANEG